MSSDRIITLWQPWASAIARGLKTVETRSWRCPHFSGDLYIHAAKRKVDKKTFDWFEDNLDIDTLGRGFDWDSLSYGAIVCRAKVTNCLKMTDDLIKGVEHEELIWGDWKPGRWAWYLELLESFEDDPIFVKGQQGLYPVPTSICGDPRLNVGSNALETAIAYAKSIVEPVQLSLWRAQ